MLYRRIELIGFTLTLNASKAGIEISFSFSGKFWDKLITYRRDVYERHMEKIAVGSEKTPKELALDKPNIPNTDEKHQSLLEQISKHTWYHTIDLGDAIQTKGQFDHLSILPLYQLPNSLVGKRVLDVATFDGFWAFEFEKRGAKEVIALDLNKPADLDWQPKRLKSATEEELSVKFGNGFYIAKKCLRSNVKRVVCNVYDLSPEKFGLFDVVHAGDFLLHLNNPVKALQNIARVCSGYAIISEVYFPELEAFGDRKLAEYCGGKDDVVWWKLSLATLKQMIYDAGFSNVEIVTTFKYGQNGCANNMNHVIFKAYK